MNGIHDMGGMHGMGAIDVREGLRALLLANNGEELDEPAVERLERAASRAGVRVFEFRNYEIV